MRIARLLGFNEAPTFPRTAAVILLALAGTAAGVIAHGIARGQSAASEQNSSSNRVAFDEMAGPYGKWLNQEVRWIITPEERQEFLRLTNNQERNEFIEQFWDRRNPSPGGQNNPVRQEHYRRIAYATAHFSAGGEAGWESDRGHVYIVFGPPDSIDSHPGGGIESTKPLDVWHYRSIQIQEPPARDPDGPGYTAHTAVLDDFDFRFVDDCACGRYQLRSAWPSAAAQNNAPVDSGSVQPVSEVRAGTSTSDKARTDLSCTYYDGLDHASEGTCATRHGRAGAYYCLNNDHRELFEEQIGCEPKVIRARSLKQIVPEIGATSSPIASARPASQPQGEVSTSNVAVNVRKLTIVSDDLPESVRIQIVEEYQGRAYPLDELTERIRQNLRDRGYAKAWVEIPRPSAVLSRTEAQSFDISVRVLTGAQYTLSGFSIRGAQAISQDEIIKQFSVHPGDLFNATAIGQGLDHLRKLYVSKGYLYLGVIPQLQMDDVRRTVTLVLDINEGKAAKA